MKHIIIEGGDRLGKDTLLRNLCNHFNYNNITIRHFDKPPKGMSPKETLDFQFEVFYKEMLFVDHINDIMDGDKWGYHDNVVIWNRSHLGEYVYSQMFRGISRKDVATRLKLFEERNLSSTQYLITLTASPKFFLDQEDGESFSQDLDQKTRELQLFKEAHALSLILNKKLIKVN
ncbi:MAG TPA: hypothetical protein VMW50_00415, partial [Dehalococcoidia bacterium]|nr:hypothetical protein [Dehalococcoidia bacterium]